MAELSIKYFEDLATTGITCPPEDAFIPDGKQKYFHVLKHNPATSNCFLPTKIKEDSRIKPDACIAKSVSLSNSLEGLINAYYKTPAYKKKQRLIGVLRLTHKDGLLKQTFATGHYSWWRSKAFEPESVNIEMVEA